MIKFTLDQNLGKVVDIKATKAWCFGVDAIKSLDDLRFAGGGNKFSQLCAFKFKSINPNQNNPLFSIAYVAKMRSKIYHDGGRNPSCWYIFKHVNFKQIDVLDKKSCFINYGFDIDKFFQSDMFNLMLPKFKSAIKKGISQIPDFILSLTNQTDIDIAKKFQEAIINSLPLIDSCKVNDTYYQLKINELNGESEDSELDEKIEQELQKRGIYADLNNQIEENNNVKEKSEKAINKVKQSAKDFDKSKIKEILKKAEDKAKDPKSKSTFAKIKDQLNIVYSMTKDVMTGKYKMQFSTLCIFAAVLLYIISPVDLIPDYIPVVGIVDDAAVLTWLFKAYADEIENYKKTITDND